MNQYIPKHAAPRAAGKKHGFWFYWSVVTGAILALIACVLGALWFVLADYQASLPGQTSALLLDAMRRGDAQQVLAFAPDLPPEMQTPQQLSAYWADYLDPADLYAYQERRGEDYVFQFSANGTKAATLTMSPTGKTSRFGFPLYRTKSLTLEPLVQFTVLAPACASLSLADAPLAQTYFTEETPLTDCFAQLQNRADYTRNTYTINELRDLRTLTATCTHGTAKLMQNGTEFTVVCRPEVATQEAIAAFAEQFSKRYLVFSTARNGARAPVQAMCVPGTTFSRAVAVYGNTWGEIYTQDRYENMQITEFVQYDADAYSCNISLDYIITNREGQEKQYDFDATLYLLQQTNGDFKIVDVAFDY